MLRSTLLALSGLALFSACPRAEDPAIIGLTGYKTICYAHAPSARANHDRFLSGGRPQDRLYVYVARGELTVEATSTAPVYELYFHVPIAFEDQAPVMLTVNGWHCRRHRYVPTVTPNVLMVAEMNRAPSSTVTWVATVVVRENLYEDLPASLPIPSPGQIPPELQQWLLPTDCVQVEEPIVQQTAQQLLAGAGDLLELGDAVAHYTFSIPGSFGHYPIAFDAYYAMNWGNSCTGKAHAGVALMRALGIPARGLLNIMAFYTPIPHDHHWIMQYYAPGYGWIKTETTQGQHPVTAPHDEIITYVVQPEDEFPLFFPWGIDVSWHSSDPILAYAPDWGQAHSASRITSVTAPRERIDHALELAAAVWSYHTDYCGIELDQYQQDLMNVAMGYQADAEDAILASNLDAYLVAMQLALDTYQSMTFDPLESIFTEDFESGPGAWTHGGSGDEWEWGTPAVGPSICHSGERCWGTDLDGTYENNADCWLASPAIDLAHYSSACLALWIWNWVQDGQDPYLFDHTWMDVTIDGGATFVPLCSAMGGVNDDGHIPAVGGWHRLVLDLTPYLGETMQFRVHLHTNAGLGAYGTYVDDVEVFGRPVSPTLVAEESGSPMRLELAPPSPNPLQDHAVLRFTLPEDAHVQLHLLDASGQVVRTLVDGHRRAGVHATEWRAQDDERDAVTSGVYFARLAASGQSVTRRLVLLR